jgi:hypothetical protein
MNDERAPAAKGGDRLGDAKDTSGGHRETEEPKLPDPRELDGARYAALDCRAHSDQARAVVAAVTDLGAHELTGGNADQ